MSKSSSPGFVTVAAILIVATLTAVALQLNALLRTLYAAELLIERIETHLEEPYD